MRPSVRFLGCIVTKEGISSDPEKVKAILDLHGLNGGGHRHLIPHQDQMLPGDGWVLSAVF